MKKWHEIYSILVIALTKLVDQYGTEKIGSHLLTLFINTQSIYKPELAWLLKSYNIVQDKQKTGEWGTEPQIDPMQLFVSFNNKSSKYENRIKRIRALFDTLKINFDFDEIDFEGCPTPVVVQAIMLKTDKNAILLWDYFKHAVSKTVDQKIFDKTVKVHGVEATLLSIFTFWVNPKYIPLDKWTISYLTHEIKELSLEESLSSPKTLFKILNLEQRHFKIIEQNLGAIDLVKKSYEWQMNSQELAKGNFKLIGFKTLALNKPLFKILQPDTYYLLDNNLKVNADGSLEYTYDKLNVFELINTRKPNDLQININAIVGKNGSGKSTLIELFYLLLYNFSVQQGFIKSDRHGQPLHIVKGINFEIYFEYNDIFKMSYSSSDDGMHLINLYKGIIDERSEVKFESSGQNLKLYESLFYTIAINYSMYSLNSLDYTNISDGKFDWISSLTHKNDSYQTPIVITPMRENGNIDVNLEKALTRQRLLINLLRIHNSDGGNFQELSFRSLDNNKIFTHVEIVGETPTILRYRNNLKATYRERIQSINGLASKYEEVKKGDYKKKILKDYIEYLSAEEIIRLFKSIKIHYNILIDVEPAHQMYLIVKLYKICWYYQSYHRFYKIFNEIISKKEVYFNALLSGIDKDNSHITDKFKQFVSYVKSTSLMKMYQPGMKLHLDDINDNIENTLSQGPVSLEYPKRIINKGFEILYQHLIIPPIFNYTYYYNNNIKAENLSSGEQQLLSSIGNMLYHIRNLESKYADRNGGLQYRFVNVVLDEIELYFHPEYQRKYIYRLIQYLTSPSFGLNNIWGINLLFSTHSPFILSDIPSQKILRMKDGTPSQDIDGLNSFGANIHDLLNDEFFMTEGAMGEFAKKYIDDLVTELSGKKYNDQLLNEKLIELLKYKIEIIGEPLIKNSLMALWHERFNREVDIPSYDKLIEFYKANI